MAGYLKNAGRKDGCCPECKASPCDECLAECCLYPVTASDDDLPITLLAHFSGGDVVLTRSGGTFSGSGFTVERDGSSWKLSTGPDPYLQIWRSPEQCLFVMEDWIPDYDAAPDTDPFAQVIDQFADTYTVTHDGDGGTIVTRVSLCVWESANLIGFACTGFAPGEKAWRLEWSPGNVWELTLVINEGTEEEPDCFVSAGTFNTGPQSSPVGTYTGDLDIDPVVS